MNSHNPPPYNGGEDKTSSLNLYPGRDPKNLISVSNVRGLQHNSTALSWLQRGHYVWDLYGNPIVATWKFDKLTTTVMPKSNATDTSEENPTETKKDASIPAFTPTPLHPQTSFSFDLSKHPRAFSNQIQAVDAATRAVGVRSHGWQHDEAAMREANRMASHALPLEHQTAESLPPHLRAVRAWLMKDKPTAVSRAAWRHVVQDSALERGREMEETQIETEEAVEKMESPCSTTLNHDDGSSAVAGAGAGAGGSSQPLPDNHSDDSNGDLETSSDKPVRRFSSSSF